MPPPPDGCRPALPTSWNSLFILNGNTMAFAHPDVLADLPLTLRRTFMPLKTKQQIVLKEHRRAGKEKGAIHFARLNRYGQFRRQYIIKRAEKRGTQHPSHPAAFSSNSLQMETILHAFCIPREGARQLIPHSGPKHHEKQTRSRRIALRPTVETENNSVGLCHVVS